MDYESIAKKILQRVGGKENVISLVHCMTRLRFTLKDESIVDDEAVKKTKGVMGIMKKAGQYQIIIGNDVANVYAELNKLGNFSNEVPKKAPQNKEKQNVFSMLMDTISGIMAPVIPAIIGAAMIKVLLTLLPMIGVLSTKGDTYNLLSVMGDGAFFFMPVLIAISASKKFVQVMSRWIIRHIRFRLPRYLKVKEKEAWYCRHQQIMSGVQNQAFLLIALIEE